MNKKQTATGLSQKSQPKNVGAIAGKKPVDLNLVLTAIGSGLLSRGDMIEGEKLADNPKIAQARDMFELGVGKLIEDYVNAVEAISAFNDWLETTDWTYERVRTFVVLDFAIGCKVQTKSGEVYTEMRISPISDDYSAIIKEARQELAEIFNGAFAGNGNQQLPDGQSKASSYTTQKGVHCSTLRISIYQGKTVAHVIPDDGPWVQYGFPLYKDVAKKAGIDLPTDEGEYETNWTVTVEFKDDDKPRRVSEITSS